MNSKIRLRLGGVGLICLVSAVGASPSSDKVQASQASQASQRIVVSGNQDLDLTEAEVRSLQELALRGDGKAANRLASYYGFVKFDNPKTMYWETISAEDGDPTGMYSLGLSLKQGASDRQALVRARYWLERAKSAGDPMAESVLQTMDN